MKITEISIKRPTLAVVIFTILLLAGGFSYSLLNYEFIPKIAPPVLTVVSIYPGASPSEVEQSVTKKLEDAIAPMEGIKDIKSTSEESVSLIIAEFDYAVDIDLTLQDAQRKINAVLKDLPEDVEAPTLDKFDIAAAPVIIMGATSDMGATEFYDIVKNKIQPNLAQVKGVAKVNLIGGNEREIRINLDAKKLEAYKVSIMQITQAIQSNNMDFPTGKIKNEKGQSLIRLAGKYTSTEEIRNLVVGIDKNKSKVYLHNVAEVEDGAKEVKIISRINGKSAIGMEIVKQSDANAVEMSKIARTKLAEIEKQYKKSNLKFTIANDTSEFTLDAANAVIFDLTLAVILVAIIMLLFLHSLRNALIVMVAVPVSIIATFSIMYLLGFSLNLLTLLALSLVVGILVDDAIVVIENIYRHMEMGKNRIQASIDAVKEIGLTVFGITLVLVVVFFPIALTSGMTGMILNSFAITVVVATLLSLLVSFMLVPLLTAKFGKLEHINKNTLWGKFINGFEKGIDNIIELFVSVLKWSLNNKIVTILIVIVMFFGSTSLVSNGFIGSTFMASGDQGEFIIQVELGKDATVEQTNFAMRKIEKELEGRTDVINYFTKVGTKTGQSAGQSTAYLGEINVKLVPKQEREYSDLITAKKFIKKLNEQIQGVKITQLPVSMGGPPGSPIQVIISSSNLDTLMKFSKKVKNIVETIDGTSEVKTSSEEGSPEVVVKVDREKMAYFGLSLAEVGGTMRTAFNGNDESQYKDGEYEYDINILVDKFDRKNTEDINNLTFVNKDGEIIKLKQFATSQDATGPSKLERTDRISSIKIESQAIGRPSGDIGNDIKKRLAGIEIPEGIEVSYGGDLKNQAESFASLGIALLASIILVYLIMVALYDSYVYPLVVLFSIPLSIIGALLALALAKQSLSLFSILGIIMLVGMVAKNAILIVDFVNQAKAEGKELKPALIESVRLRFRPIVMTTLAMVFGILPVALASGAGAEWKNGLGWALIGGLASSMFFSMIIVPLVYYIFDRTIEKLGGKKKNTDNDNLDTENIKNQELVMEYSEN